MRLSQKVIWNLPQQPSSISAPGEQVLSQAKVKLNVSRNRLEWLDTALPVYGERVG
jgi:hypothetical protein